jgi:hypothetical protein
VHHCSLFRFFSRSCSISDFHLHSLVFVCYVSLCYVSLALGICCFPYVGSFPWCLSAWFPSYCIYLFEFHFVQRYGLCWGGGQVV